MSQIADTASDQLIAHLASMFELFCRAFQDPSLIVATSAAKCLVALVPALERKHVVYGGLDATFCPPRAPARPVHAAGCALLLGACPSASPADRRVCAEFT